MKRKADEEVVEQMKILFNMLYGAPANATWGKLSWAVWRAVAPHVPPLFCRGLLSCKWSKGSRSFVSELVDRYAWMLNFTNEIHEEGRHASN